jgi:hypothetical protein
MVVFGIIVFMRVNVVLATMIGGNTNLAVVVVMRNNSVCQQDNIGNQNK